jgi:hypothetical protein
MMTIAVGVAGRVMMTIAVGVAGRVMMTVAVGVAGTVMTTVAIDECDDPAIKGATLKMHSPQGPSHCRKPIP